MQYSSVDVLEADFARVLRDLGIHRALGLLNLRTWHRYTGVYEFNRSALRCVSLFDREHLGVQTAPDELLAGTYCAIVARYSTSFATRDSFTDARLDHHPARGQVRAFHAVPLFDFAQRCFGALVHWDVRPQELHSKEMRLLFAVAPILARTLLGVRRSLPWMSQPRRSPNRGLDRAAAR